MSMWDVIVTEAAFADAYDAARYMRDQLGSPEAAARFVEEFAERVDNLSAFPEARPVVSDEELAELGYRWGPVGKYMLFYRVDKKQRRVIVERLLYGARDWKSLL
jgi:toxin ParE1/3/4